jgi:UDP-glucose 6-dehydrogenase
MECHRNQVVHEYFSIDEARVFVIIKEDIPVFEKQIWEIVEQELNNGNFALEEYNVAKNSDYYKIVNFKF